MAGTKFTDDPEDERREKELKIVHDILATFGLGHLYDIHGNPL
jgi:hypothetical protein